MLIFSVGSDPIERKQTSGVLQVLSSHMDSMSRITPSANYIIYKHIIIDTMKPSTPHTILIYMILKLYVV